MRLSTIAAAAIACLGIGASSFAQTAPVPTYVKKAVFVRIHWDATFYNYWSRTKSDRQLDEMVTGYFNDVRNAYKNAAALHNIDLFLLDDFDRVQGPMADYSLSNPASADAQVRLSNELAARLRTGNVTRTVASGATHQLGRTVNWVFTHNSPNGYGGRVNKIGGIADPEGHMWISTMLPTGGEQTRALVLLNLKHEFGHLVGGEHKTTPASERPECNGSNPELMCNGVANAKDRFGTRNYQRVEGYMKGTLQRCNSAFSSTNSCENFVSNMCSSILDYTQIQNCIDSNRQAMCRDICTLSQKSARVLINSFGRIVTEADVDGGPLGR